MKNPRIILIRSLLSVFVLTLATISSHALTDEEKAAAFEARRPEIRQRLIEHYEKTPLETKILIREISDYNFGKSGEIPLVEGILKPDADPLEQLYPIRKIRLDDHTLPMIINLLEVSPEDSIKSKIVWRLRDEILTGKLELSPEIESLLKSYADGGEYFDSELHRASALTLRQAHELQEKVSVGELKSTIEEPIEVATTEASEKSVEQSSNGWLWLVGVLVVVGGLGLMFRKKS